LEKPISFYVSSIRIIALYTPPPSE